MKLLKPQMDLLNRVAGSPSPGSHQTLDITVTWDQAGLFGATAYQMRTGLADKSSPMSTTVISSKMKIVLGMPVRLSSVLRAQRCRGIASHPSSAARGVIDHRPRSGVTSWITSPSPGDSTDVRSREITGQLRQRRG